MADAERQVESGETATSTEERLPGNEFLAALAHEIRNPLTPILAATQVLRSLCKDSRQQFAIDTIEGQVVQLTHLMDSLVDATQLRRGELNLAGQSVDIGALATRVVEAESSKIDASRQSFGLPLEKAAQPAEAASAKTSSGRNILVVEDNASIANELASSLANFGNRVVVAGDGASAIRLSRSFLPDVVIVDIGLPDQEGFEVARELKKIPAVAGALLIAATGHHLRAFRHVADHMVFDHYLLKPYCVSTLSALIEHSWEKRDGRTGQDGSRE